MPYERLDSDTPAPAAPPLLTTSSAAAPSPVILYSTPDISHERFEGRTAIILGAVQVAGGIVAVVSQIVLIVIKSVATYIGAGFWCGVAYILAGAFGIAAGKTKSYCLMVTYKVLAIIALVLSIGLIFGTVLPLVYDYDHMYHTHNTWVYNSTTGEYSFIFEEKFFHHINLSIAFNSIQIIVLITELVTLCWGSALVCKVTCCAPRMQQAIITTQVKYVDGQAVLVLDSSPVPPGEVKPSDGPINTSLQPSDQTAHVMQPH